MDVVTLEALVIPMEPVLKCSLSPPAARPLRQLLLSELRLGQLALRLALKLELKPALKLAPRLAPRPALGLLPIHQSPQLPLYQMVRWSLRSPECSSGEPTRLLSLRGWRRRLSKRLMARLSRSLRINCQLLPEVQYPLRLCRTAK
jgi:hypothetical protein